MTPKRGDVWLANLNPIRGSEQAGTRPVLIFQNDSLNKVTSTFLAIPFTSNLRRAALPSCVRIAQGDGGLANDSVALCHQLRVIDKSRLLHRLGQIDGETLSDIEAHVMLQQGLPEATESL